MYAIEYTREAAQDLKWFKKHEQAIIIDAINTQLHYEPTLETRNRFPQRDGDSKISDWELRVADFRVYYNVDEQVRIVRIERITEKRNNWNLFRGRKER